MATLTCEAGLGKTAVEAGIFWRCAGGGAVAVLIGEAGLGATVVGGVVETSVAVLTGEAGLGVAVLGIFWRCAGGNAPAGQ